MFRASFLILSTIVFFLIHSTFVLLDSFHYRFFLSTIVHSPPTELRLRRSIHFIHLALVAYLVWLIPFSFLFIFTFAFLICSIPFSFLFVFTFLIAFSFHIHISYSPVFYIHISYSPVFSRHFNLKRYHSYDTAPPTLISCTCATSTFTTKFLCFCSLIFSSPYVVSIFVISILQSSRYFDSIFFFFSFVPLIPVFRHSISIIFLFRIAVFQYSSNCCCHLPFPCF